MNALTLPALPSLAAWTALVVVMTGCGSDEAASKAGPTVVALEAIGGFDAIELTATPSKPPKGDIAGALRSSAATALEGCKAFSGRDFPNLEFTLDWRGDSLKASLQDTMQDSVKACLAKSFERQGLSGGGEPGKLTIAMRAK